MYQAPFPHGLMFHHFHGNGHPRVQGSISGDEFSAILDFVDSDRVQSPKQWLERLRERGLHDHDLCITFDDGLLGQFQVALPILEARGLKAFWFVYSSAVKEGAGKLEIYRQFRTRFFDSVDDFYDRFFARASALLGQDILLAPPEGAVDALRKQYLFYSKSDAEFRIARDQVLGPERYEALMDELIRETGVDQGSLSRDIWLTDEHLTTLAKRGHVIGLHSYTHPTAISDLSYEAQLSEYQSNLEHIHAATGASPMSVAYPTNSYNDDSLRVLRYLGVWCGFRSNMHRPSEARGDDAALLLPREDHANIYRMLSDANNQETHEDQ